MGAMSTDARALAIRGPRVLIVDDEPLARRFLHQLLVRDGSVGEIRHCTNGLEAKAEIARARPDILFLDVEMPGLNGADLMSSLPADDTPVTIFTTAYSQHAIRAFELAACDYLLKPFDEARFAKVRHFVSGGNITAGARCGFAYGEAFALPTVIGASDLHSLVMGGKATAAPVSLPGQPAPPLE